jgi:hypothetical protein
MFWLIELNVDFWLAKKWALVIKVEFNILETFYYIHFRFKFYFWFNSTLEKVFPVLYTSSWYSTNHKARFQFNLQFQNNQKSSFQVFPGKAWLTWHLPVIEEILMTKHEYFNWSRVFEISWKFIKIRRLMKRFESGWANLYLKRFRLEGKIVR